MGDAAKPEAVLKAEPPALEQELAVVESFAALFQKDASNKGGLGAAAMHEALANMLETKKAEVRAAKQKDEAAKKPDPFALR